MAYINDYQAITGLAKVYIAVQTEDTKEKVAYSTVHEIDVPKSFGVTPEASVDKAHAGNRVIQVAQTRSGATFNMSFHSLPDELKEEILGEERKEDGLTYSNSKHVSPYLGVIAEFTKEDGTSKFVGLTKVILSPNAEEGTTKEDATEFGELAFEGEAIDRIFDGERKISKSSSDEDYDFTTLSSAVFMNKSATPQA